MKIVLEQVRTVQEKKLQILKVEMRIDRLCHFGVRFTHSG